MSRNLQICSEIKGRVTRSPIGLHDIVFWATDSSGNSVADPEVDADPPCPTVVTSWRAPALHGGLPARSGADETSPDYVAIGLRISADNWVGVALQDIIKKGR